MKKGKHNSITDVKGIRVGHCTLESEHLHTGVTVVLPSHDNIFQNKLIAASHVINGFGKTTGLLQINELSYCIDKYIKCRNCSAGIGSIYVINW